MHFCVFSKHFQALDFRNLGRTLKNLGVEGVDLTVRRGGHIEPVEVKEKLLKAKEIFLQEGISITMITTEITDINQPYAKEIIDTASGLGIGCFKLGYYPYQGFGTLKKSMKETNAKLKDVSAICKEKKIRAGFHNHSGDYLGASVPHIADLFKDCSPEWLGVYYDIGHAAIEGGFSGWKMNLDYVSDRLFMVAIKDLCFARMENVEAGKWQWQVKVVPMGEGMVNWREFFGYLESINFEGPVSIHSEYNLPVEQVIDQTRRDLDFLKKLEVR